MCGKIGLCGVPDAIVAASSPRSGTPLLIEALHCCWGSRMQSDVRPIAFVVRHLCAVARHVLLASTLTPPILGSALRVQQSDNVSPTPWLSNL